jgi:hypothetical protein
MPFILLKLLTFTAQWSTSFDLKFSPSQQAAIDLAKTETVLSILTNNVTTTTHTNTPTKTPTTNARSPTPFRVPKSQPQPRLMVSPLKLSSVVYSPLMSIGGAHTSRDGNSRPFIARTPAPSTPDLKSFRSSSTPDLKSLNSSSNLIINTETPTTPSGLTLAVPGFSVTTITTGISPAITPTRRVPSPPGPPPSFSDAEDENLRRDIRELEQINDRLRTELVEERDKLFDATDQIARQQVIHEKLLADIALLQQQQVKEKREMRKRNRPIQLMLLRYLVDSLRREGGLSDYAIEQVENMVHLPNSPPRLVKYLCEGILHRVAVRNTTYKYRIQGMLDFDEYIDEDIFFEGSSSLKSLDALRNDPVDLEAREILLVNAQSDLELLTFVEQLRYDMRSVSDLKKAYAYLSQAVDQRMGRVSERAHNGTNEHITRLKQEIGSNVIHIGLVRRGTSRHRSILFKFLCDELRSDRLPLKCRLVQGEGSDHAWNVVVRDNQMFIVDLMEMPGVLFPEGSCEADDYKRGSFTGKPSTAPFVRGWLRPLDVNRDLMEKVEIGSGGYGKVYSVTVAHHEHVVQLAMKVVELSMMTQKERDKAAEELDLLRYMKHRHVISLRYGCIVNMQMYMFMDLMDLNFHDFIHNNTDAGPYFEREMIFTLLGTARGIYYLHIKNLIHRDIKPAVSIHLQSY